MFKLEKEKTGSTPYISIDEEKGHMYFKGESFHENVVEFYSDVIEWLQTYINTDFERFQFDCELKYFNSSTAKMLWNMIVMLDEACGEGKNIKVNWITTEDNEINIECGEDFADEVEFLPIEIVLHPM